MNKRDYKQCGRGEFYHIYNRGNGKESIFLDDQDCRFFLGRLCQILSPETKTKDRIQPLPVNSFSLISYCIMPNHFHFLIQQNGDIPTSKLIAKLCTSYSKYFNNKYSRVGHVFQDKFKQINVHDNRYLMWLSCYIHQNPKVAGLVRRAEDYIWSSLSDFLGRQGGVVCSKEIILEQFSTPDDYKKYVESSYEIIMQNKSMRELLLD